MGESIVEASLKGAFCDFYATSLPAVSTGSIPRAFRTGNDRGSYPIDTELYPWTGWERFIDSSPMNSSVDFCSVCFFTRQAAPDSLVRSKVITYLL